MLEPGKSTEVREWEGAEAAEREVEEARQRYNEAHLADH